MAEADPTIELPSNYKNSLRNGHIQRSRLLDAFTKLETAITALLGNLDIEFSETSSVGQRIGKIDECSFELFKKRQRVPALLKRAGLLVETRNSIIHAKLQGTSREDGKVGWKFINVGRTSAEPTVLTNEEFETLRQEVLRVGHRLSQIKPKAPTQAVPAATTAKS